MNAVTRLSTHLHAELDKVVVGQHDLKRESLVVLLCQGHALIEGVPGLAKTLAVKAIARVLGLGFQRVQCTPDLMPADILGTTVASVTTGTFQLHKGPAFTDLLLVDEINRMPPRTQAALLECMEERQITLDGERHALSPFFTVFATQNPVDFEGTYPLPEAQLDRFLAKIRVTYPDAAEETQLLGRVHAGFDSRDLEHVTIEPLAPGLLAEARAELNGITIQDTVIQYVVSLVRHTRDWPALTLGASPRASVSVMRFAAALAALDGRDFVLPDDVKAALPPVLRHRLIVRPEADLEGLTPDRVIEDVLRAVEMPR